MSREETAGLVRYLSEKVTQGYTIVTWNGVGFDFDVLAEEAQCLPSAAPWRLPTWT